MLHVSIGLAIIASTCVALTVYAALVGREVSTAFVLASFVGLGASGALLAFVNRERQ